MIEFAARSRIYIDTNVWIYYVEGHPTYWDKIARLFAQAARVGAAFVTSEITIAECLIKPARMHDADLTRTYLTFFDGAEIERLPIIGGQAQRAALRGGAMGLKLIDAIHLVSAMEADCRYFLTGDQRFRSSANIEVVSVTV